MFLGQGIHFLAETACAQLTFRKEARVVNKHHMVFAHGQFPKPMMSTKKGAPSAKGQCMGVGMITSIPQPSVCWPGKDAGLESMSFMHLHFLHQQS